jgi:hypothetical protein
MQINPLKHTGYYMHHLLEHLCIRSTEFVFYDAKNEKHSLNLPWQWTPQVCLKSRYNLHLPDTRHSNISEIIFIHNIMWYGDVVFSAEVGITFLKRT